MKPLEAMPRSERLLIYLLAGMQFTHIVDFMIMSPLGPVFARLFQINAQQFGSLVSAYSLSGACVSLIAANFIARFERKKLILILYSGFILATLLCGFASGYASLLCARCLAGMFGGLLSAMVYAYIADIVPYQRRGRAMGILMSAFSLATIAGVPFGLLLAHYFSFRGPFIFIAALSVLFLMLAAWRLPRVPTSAQDQSQLAVLAVLREPNHLLAFIFVAFMLASSFLVIPYISMFLVANVHVQEAHLSLIYLLGGAATFFTSRFWGVLTDRYGKVRVYRWIAWAAMLPLLMITHLGVVPLWFALLTTTIFFIFVSGRMVPGMALVTSSARPELRTTFMTMNTTVQSAAMGLAAFIGGWLMTRNPQGELLHFNRVGYLAVIVGLAAIVLVGRLRESCESR